MTSTTAGDGVKLNFNTDWSYAPAPETAKVEIKPRYELFIDGKFAAPAKGQYFDTINPANERKLAAVASATSEDVDRAVKAARQRRRDFPRRHQQREIPGDNLSRHA